MLGDEILHLIGIGDEVIELGSRIIQKRVDAVGDSRERLPEVLQAIDRVDVFMHDSLHTDEHILMEFEAVLPHMNDRGLLLCDDVKESRSLAFLRLCADLGLAHVRFKERLGVAVLPEDYRSRLSTAPAERRQAAVHGAGQ